MTKIIFSTVTLFLLLQGCGSSSSDNNCSEPNTKVSKEIKSFASSFKDTRTMNKSVMKSSSSTSKALESTKANKQAQQKQTLESCTNGGTKKIITEADFDGLSQIEAIEFLSKGFSITINEDGCIEDGEKVNASMTIVSKLKDELMTIDIKFNKNSTFEDLETTEIITISKDSKIKIKEISDEERILTENMKISSSKGKNYESINLISHDIEGESTESFYDISGKRIDNGITYSVDKNYDASKTPMIINNSDDLLSGTAKYFNTKNEHITVKVIEKNKIKVSVDSNNDGVDDAEETMNL